MENQIAIDSNQSAKEEHLRYLIEEDRPPARQTQKLIEYMHRTGRPAFVGSIAIEIGWSIDNTMEMIERYVYDGALRWATQKELKELSAPSNAFVVVMIDMSKFGQTNQ
jgi:hypothetical protein